MSRRAAVFALIVLAFWSSPVARGQQGEAINYGELFQSLDANNDTVISRGEVPESGRAAFDRLAKLGDSNKDGKIDRIEYRALLERTREKMGTGGNRFTVWDKNADGKVSRDEFTGAAPLFDRIDANKDGILSRDEAVKFALASGAGGLNQFGPRFKEMDKNSNGKVSRDEFTGLPAVFDRIDANTDGQLVPAEVREYQRNRAPALKKAAAPEKVDAKKPSDDGK